MKAITIRQPWAQLIALGVKTIETRSWSTDYRGPLAIHAGETYKPFLPDDPEKRLWSSGSRVLIEPKAGNEETWKHGNPFHRLPSSAVVAVASLVDVVPIAQWCDPGEPTRVVNHGNGTLDLAVLVDPDSSGSLVPSGAHMLTDVSDQLPYGDFTPGRFAWLLAGVTPCLIEDVIGRSGLWDVCPDGGQCHHECEGDGCWRVANAGPLSGVCPNDRWPEGDDA